MLLDTLFTYTKAGKQMWRKFLLILQTLTNLGSIPVYSVQNC